MKAFACKSLKLSSNKVLVLGSIKEPIEPLIYANNYFQDLLRLVQIYQQYYPEPVSAIQQEIKAIELEFIIQDSEKLFQSMNMGVDRIRDIVISLRNFSRLDEAEFKVTDIHQGIDSTLVILNSRLKSVLNFPKGIQVIRDYGKLPLIECYPGHLNQVFMNLIVNAIDALEEGITNQQFMLNEKSPIPTIHICTEVLKNDWVIIRITDNGQGMDEKVRSKLFDPFFTTKDVGKGTGLGLSISYRIIVELHGGKLECYSAPGTGAEFVIQIPTRR